MSSIAFFCIPAHGHTNPTVEVVRELTRRGHTVWYYSFAPFREKLEAAGARVILCDAYLPPMTPSVEKKVGKDFAALIEMAADTTLRLEEKVCGELAAFCPQVIVSDSVCLWGKLFAAKLGIPYVCSTTTFAFNQHTAGLIRRRPAEVARMALGMPRMQKKLKLLRENGYPVKSVVDLIQNDNHTDTVVYTAREFQPLAETFSERYAFVGPSLAESSAPKEEKSRPLIYISLGTVMNRNPEFYRNCIRAFADEEADVILSVGEGTDLDSLGPLPPHVQAAGRVDQLAVLRRADVFLTHCGMNSANECIWCGVPAVLFPQQSEEDLVASRMEELGVGLRLKQDTPEAIRETVLSVLHDSSYRERTLGLAEKFHAAGGAPKAADAILKVIKPA